MAHCAEIDADNIVLRVVVVDNTIGDDNVEEWCREFFGSGTWKRTSYSGAIRKHYAGIGFKYDAARDAFIAPQPAPDWTFDEATCNWLEPT